MAESIDTIQLDIWVKRLQAGDTSAQEELLRRVGERLEKLKRKMLRDFPRVRRFTKPETCFRISPGPL